MNATRPMRTEAGDRQMAEGLVSGQSLQHLKSEVRAAFPGASAENFDVKWNKDRVISVYNGEEIIGIFKIGDDDGVNCYTYPGALGDVVDLEGRLEYLGFRDWCLECWRISVARQGPLPKIFGWMRS